MLALIILLLCNLLIGFGLGRIYDLHQKMRVLKWLDRKLHKDGIHSEEDSGFYRGAMWVFERLR